MLSFIVRLAAFAVGSLIGKWLALDLPDIIRERQHKKENIASAAAREQEKLLRERLKERYKMTSTLDLVLSVVFIVSLIIPGIFWLVVIIVSLLRELKE